MLYVLGKGADLLIDEAVVLSEHWGVPKVLIGGNYPGRLRVPMQSAFTEFLRQG
jgi:hypothetical protein